jgi:hypothetical protein
MHERLFVSGERGEVKVLPTLSVYPETLNTVFAYLMFPQYL